jgi:cytochrome c553
MSGHKLFWVLGIGCVLGAIGLMWNSFVQSDGQEHRQVQTSSKISPQVQRELDVCYRCHGAGGVSTRPIYPTIAGQKREYIRQQLLVFKHITDVDYANEVGDRFDTFREKLPQRSNVAMDGMAQSVPRHLVEPVARAISDLACDGGKPKAKPVNPLMMPNKALRCATCHGQDGISLKPNVPNLAGQQRAYLRRQLMLMRDAAMGKVPHDGSTSRSHAMMTPQASNLTNSDIDVLSDYFAALDCRGDGA